MKNQRDRKKKSSNSNPNDANSDESNNEAIDAPQLKNLMPIVLLHRCRCHLKVAQPNKNGMVRSSYSVNEGQLAEFFEKCDKIKPIRLPKFPNTQRLAMLNSQIQMPRKQAFELNNKDYWGATPKW
ncbi:584_t:CDS:2 [Ambispora leptoticha]|uniref:584_t:CDS:1 n=1 Tax=Ambispora leptoticha TaxID=144679 RepID=A0A9N8ZP57_9GLOM|nr:584_t:CDS:2 [Ambispora leptoticha]